jgi:hypothetical protein
MRTCTHRIQQAFTAEAQRLEEQNMLVEEKYESVTEALKGKSEKLRTLRKRVKETEDEKHDLIHEFETEREGLLDSIRDAFKELRLHKRIAQQCMFQADIDKIVLLSEYSLARSVWDMPKIELPVALPQLGGRGMPSAGANRGGGGEDPMKGSAGARRGRSREVGRSREFLDAPSAATAGWKKSVVSSQEQYDLHDQAKQQKQHSARARSPAVPVPSRLNKMDNGMEVGEAIRSHSRGGGLEASPGGGGARGLTKFSASFGKEADDSRRALPDSAHAVPVRANFEGRGALPLSARGGRGEEQGDLGSMQLPVARPHFEANKPKLGGDSDAHEELLSRVDAVPRRQNFDASGKPRLGGEPASERGDVLDKMGSVPRRKNFGAPKLGANARAEEEPEEPAVFAAMGRVPPRANFSGDKLGGQGAGGGGGGGGGGEDLLFSSMDKVPRRKNFEGMGKGLSVSDADEHSTAINSMPEIKRGAFNPGALGANGGGHSDSGMKRASDLPVRASFNPGASYVLSADPTLCFSRLFAHFPP